jgi:hypothetical protein
LLGWSKLQVQLDYILVAKEIIYISPYKIPNIHVLAPSDKFTFSNSYGKCVPDPQGSLSLDQCIVLYNKNITRPEYIGKYPNILTYLRARYGEERQSKIFPIICIVGAIILLICILILLHSALKNIPRK